MERREEREASRGKSARERGYSLAAPGFIPREYSPRVLTFPGGSRCCHGDLE